MLNKRKAHVRTKRCPTRRLDEREERRIIRGLFGDQIVCLPCIVQKNLAFVVFMRADLQSLSGKAAEVPVAIPQFFFASGADQSGRQQQQMQKNKKTLTFKSADLAPQVIKSDDPIWQAWLAGGSDKDPPQIYVLVQLPKVFDAAKDDKEGNEDARRQILTTKSCRWQSSSMGGAPMVKLVIDADRINTVTAAKPE